jgi:hypothetical protein
VDNRAVKARRNSRHRAPGHGAPRDAARPFELFAADRFATDPITGGAAEVRHIQPHAATKGYLCPGCNKEILPGVGHVVVVPLAEPDERRHWHSGCWRHRAGRPPGR